LAVPFSPLPDVEAALVTYLTSHAALAPLHGGRVGTELHSDLTSLQVTALGGVQPWPWESTPEFAVGSWGGTKAQASALDLAVAAAVFDLVGTSITGGRVIGAGVRLAHLWSPADDTGRPKYRTDFALTVSP
jgi:hypothetical protein